MNITITRKGELVIKLHKRERMSLTNTEQFATQLENITSGASAGSTLERLHQAAHDVRVMIGELQGVLLAHGKSAPAAPVSPVINRPAEGGNGDS